MDIGKIPPHDTEAKQAVLGSMLTDQDAVIDAIEVLKPEDFYFYVVCDKDVHNHKKLTVKYTNIPHNVEITDISPKRLNYIILNQ